MGFNEVQSFDCDTTVSLGGINKETKKKNPIQVEGYFLGSKTVAGGKFGDSVLHILKTPDGNLGVWGKTNLNQKLLSVTPGTMVRITQSGMVPTKNGDMYKYKVEVDTDNTIEVAAALAASSSEATEEAAEETQAEFSEEEPEEEELEEEEAPVDEAPPARAARPATKTAAVLPSATQQKKVRDLLKGKSTRAA